MSKKQVTLEEGEGLTITLTEKGGDGWLEVAFNGVEVDKLIRQKQMNTIGKEMGLVEND